MNFDLNISIEDDISEEDEAIRNDKDRERTDHDDETCGDDSLSMKLERRFRVGSTLESLDQVYLLYCEYGRCRGFSVRKGDQTYFLGTNELRMKEYVCSCEGQHDDKRSKGRLAVYKKQTTRCGCKASIRIVRDMGSPWKVYRFIKEHNHEMYALNQSYLLRSARHLSQSKGLLVEALNTAGIGVSRACRFMENEAGGVQNIGFTRKDAYNHLNRVKQSSRVNSLDANGLVQFFVKKSNKEPFFYWNVQSDDEGRLMNFFFRDSRCLIDYESFGDVLSVDTTYKTNKYNLICASFVEFEMCWSSMIQTFSLANKRWFSNMYKLRKRWASVFTNNCFTAGLLATSRSESTNKVLKDLCNARCSLVQFIQNYKRIQSDWRTNETADDASNIGISGLFIDNNLLLSHASKLYTRNVFKSFESQLALALSVVVIGNPVDVDDVEVEFKVASQPLMTRIRRVQFNRQSHKASYSCHMWETGGVLCRHIFRVYLAKNVTKMPECYIMRRWCKNAKQRHLNEIGKYSNASANDVVGEMAFVNYIMRATLDLAHDAKQHKDSRKIMLDRIQALKIEITSKNKDQAGANVNDSAEQGLQGRSTPPLRAPASHKRGAIANENLQSHWSRKKMVECSQQSASIPETGEESMRESPSVSHIIANNHQDNYRSFSESGNDNLDADE
ncbi:hypothetical protein C2S52_010540 [Perilla frutescens var. hirtella]|nr:hypothetical protein C2S52_010540 [Perilla frutescens var. hirtella]KAH6817372.1 hypothetical protein C2S51_000975 [Perilla frutescens var. frutescens]